MVRRTKAEAAQTRENILDAAEQLFMRYGVGRTSLEQIAKAAELTRGAVYWHFRNKDDLFDAMLARVRAPMAIRLEKLAEQGGTLADLRDTCQFALQQLADDPHCLNVFTILFHRTECDNGLARQRAMAQESLQQLEAFFSHQSMAPSLHPSLTPALAARAVHAQIAGIFHDWLRDPAGWNMRDKGPVIFEATLRGLLAAPTQDL